jgi:hypothetical protein
MYWNPELAQIALRTGIDYAVIDYTLTSGDLVVEGLIP